MITRSSGGVFRLGPPEIGINTALDKQVSVRRSLGDTALIKDDDVVCVHNR
jgi:hypothetical protein